MVNVVRLTQTIEQDLTIVKRIFFPECQEGYELITISFIVFDVSKFLLKFFNANN